MNLRYLIKSSLDKCGFSKQMKEHLILAWVYDHLNLKEKKILAGVSLLNCFIVSSHFCSHSTVGLSLKNIKFPIMDYF